ncbi:MIP18 protein galla-2 [Blastocladiella emersonii ATCC 22665]|nr:MIP18 protein galla-2 [Blastocladiella emersonii ATCC 22665]
MSALQNENPTIYELSSHGPRAPRAHEEDESAADPFDAEEIFDLIRNINDPEHPLTLEQLNVTQQRLIDVDDATGTITVRFTPTIPHCSMATLIGLCIRVRLLRALPARFKVRVLVTEGTHNSEVAVNKQLNDKERVAAALENSALSGVVNQCLASAILTT